MKMGSKRSKVLIGTQHTALIVHLNVQSKGLYLYLKLFGTNKLLFWAVCYQQIAPPFLQHPFSAGRTNILLPPPQNRQGTFTYPGGKELLGGVVREKRCQPSGNHWSEICQVLEKYMFFYLGQRCWLPCCV